jgi:hypothetical protein
VYRPETFRSDVRALAGAARYAEAAAYLRSVDLTAQLRHDRTGYVAVALDNIVLPGAPAGVRYDRARDWCVPGTSDALESEAHAAWVGAAVRFAEAFNRRRSAGE